MIRIGIVGDIGCGKTFVANKFGYPVFNADLEVDKLYKTNKNCYRKLNKIFPKYINSFPISKKVPKWVATCPTCKKSFPYRRIVKGSACRTCCNNFFGGHWDEKCLLTYKPFSEVK